MKNNRFNIKLRVFELIVIFLASLNFISLMISIFKTTIHIFVKKKFKEIKIKPFNFFSKTIYMTIRKESLKKLLDSINFRWQSNLILRKLFLKLFFN